MDGSRDGQRRERQTTSFSLNKCHLLLWDCTTSELLHSGADLMLMLQDRTIPLGL